MGGFIVNQFYNGDEAETKQESFIQVPESVPTKDDQKVWKSIRDIDITVKMLNEMLHRTIKVLSKPKVRTFISSISVLILTGHFYSYRTVGMTEFRGET